MSITVSTRTRDSSLLELVFDRDERGEIEASVSVYFSVVFCDSREDCDRLDIIEYTLRALDTTESSGSLRSVMRSTGRQAAMSARPASIMLQYNVVPTVTGMDQYWK